MANLELERIIGQLKAAYEGPAWHGPALKEVISKITAIDATKYIGDAHNIAELIYHMIAWRTYLIKHLEGETAYKVSNEKNFKPFKNLYGSEWNGLKAELEKNQNNLLDLLSKQDDTLLTQKAGSGRFDYYTLIHGVIQHDLYHLGQIIMIHKHG